MNTIQKLQAENKSLKAKLHELNGVISHNVKLQDLVDTKTDALKDIQQISHLANLTAISSNTASILFKNIENLTAGKC